VSITESALSHNIEQHDTCSYKNSSNYINNTTILPFTLSIFIISTLIFSTLPYSIPFISFHLPNEFISNYNTYLFHLYNNTYHSYYNVISINYIYDCPTIPPTYSKSAGSPTAVPISLLSIIRTRNSNIYPPSASSS
jgi:hypothetical protein